MAADRISPAIPSSRSRWTLPGRPWRSPGGARFSEAEEADVGRLGNRGRTDRWASTSRHPGGDHLGAGLEARGPEALTSRRAARSAHRQGLVPQAVPSSSSSRRFPARTERSTAPRPRRAGLSAARRARSPPRTTAAAQPVAGQRQRSTPASSFPSRRGRGSRRSSLDEEELSARVPLVDPRDHVREEVGAEGREDARRTLPASGWRVTGDGADALRGAEHRPRPGPRPARPRRSGTPARFPPPRARPQLARLLIWVDSGVADEARLAARRRDVSPTATRYRGAQVHGAFTAGRGWSMGCRPPGDSGRRPGRAGRQILPRGGVRATG